MDALLERTFQAEQRHFWFRGFKRFVAPSPPEATAGRVASAAARRRLRHRRQPFLPPSSTERRSAWSCTGEACGSDASAVCARSPGQRDGPAVRHASIDVVLSFDVLYCLAPARRKGGDCGDVPSAPARRRRSSSTWRRCRCSKATTPCLAAKFAATRSASSRAKLERAGFRRDPAHLHQRIPVSDHGHRAGAQRLRGVQDRRSEHG